MDHASKPSARLPSAARLIALALLVVGVTWYRRPDQFSHPYVWVEDGVANLPQYIADGWWFVLQPVAGYFSVPIRVLFGLAVSISFRWLPEIAVVLTLLFCYGVVAAVALAPTRLRHRFLCAASVLLVPTSSEVFGVSLYVGWWGSLLAILPLLWPLGARGHVPLRSGLLALGGLSTPIAIGLLPLYVVRLLVRRSGADGWLAVLCGALSAVQLAALWYRGPMAQGSGTTPTADAALDVAGHFFGQYLVGSVTLPPSPLYPWLGLGLIAVIAACAYARRTDLDWPFVALAGCLVLTITITVARVAPEMLHPFLAGARYFFLPYVMLSWLLLQLLDRRRPVTTALCAAALLLTLPTVWMYGPQTHQPIDWRAHVERCLTSDSHVFPVHYEGDSFHKLMWDVTVSGAGCRQLVARSLFAGHPAKTGGGAAPR
jgi:hypothetical protein